MNIEDLLDTRAGLALANTAYQEGAVDMLKACNRSGPGRVFNKPVSPYSAPLLKMIKAGTEPAATAGADLEKRVAETLAAHSIGAFSGDSTACRCDRTWRKNADYREHVTEALTAALAPVIAEHVRAERADQEAEDLLMHRAYRPEVVAEIAVSLDDECNWERIAEWCGGKLDSGPNGTDTGEWDSWITLPNGEVAGSNEWIVLDVKGEFHVRQLVGEPDTGTLPAAQAEALREAADDFEAHVGVGEFDELARRGGRPFAYIAEAWEHQSPYMDWLRARADKLVSE